jgi:hypothetical protein
MSTKRALGVILFMCAPLSILIMLWAIAALSAQSVHLALILGIPGIFLGAIGALLLLAEAENLTEADRPNGKAKAGSETPAHRRARMARTVGKRSR